MTEGHRNLQSQLDAESRRSDRLNRVRSDALHLYGERPKVESSERRQQSIDSLKFFATESGYFPMGIGSHPLCFEQLQMLERLEDVMRHGGYCAHACFRGFIKTTALRTAVLWAFLSGNKRFIPWIGQTLKAAKKELGGIKTELRSNERLLADFPDYCFLFNCIGTNERLAQNLKYDGTSCYMTLTTTDLVIPVIDDDGLINRWCAMTTRGITADDISRGLSWTAPTGENMRPDGCVLDDIQSKKSARSMNQTNDRLETVTEDIAQSGSVDRPFTILVGGTVIQKDDFMDRLIDSEEYHAWSGARVPKLKAFPNDWKNEGGLWKKYQDLRSDFVKSIPGSKRQAVKRANDFYLQNQTAMDDGGDATWQYAFKRGTEFTSIQSCMNTLFDDGEKAFWCELQQKPLNQLKIKYGGPVIQVSRTWWIDSRMPGLNRGVIPDDTIAVTGGIDVQGDILFWLIAAWRPALGGHIVDYGTFPENQGSIDLAKISHPLSDRFPNMSKKAQLRAGLNELVTDLINRQWLFKSGKTKPTARILIDSGHEAVTVYEFASESVRAAQLNPAKGYGIGVKSRPMSDWTRYVRRGDGWVLNDVDGHSCQLAHFDGNIHKRRVQDGIVNLQIGDMGKITIFDGEHSVIGEHFAAEAGVLKQEKGRSVYEWELIQEGSRNDFWDTMMMSRTAAMIEGVIEDSDSPHTTLSERQDELITSYVQKLEQQGLSVEEFNWG